MPAAVYWTSGGQPVKNNNSVKIASAAATIHMPALRLRDEGRFGRFTGHVYFREYSPKAMLPRVPIHETESCSVTFRLYEVRNRG